MRISPVKDGVSFKSGYPLFGADGHLRERSDIYDLIYVGFRPTGVLKTENSKIDYLA